MKDFFIQKGYIFYLCFALSLFCHITSIGEIFSILLIFGIPMIFLVELKSHVSKNNFKIMLKNAVVEKWNEFIKTEGLKK